jgi:cytochrome c-type biogenesis protein CcmE
MAVILAAIGFLAYQGLTNALVYYITPSQLLHAGHSDVGAQLRVGGEVMPHSLKFNAKTGVIRFVLEDPKATVAVVSTAVPPAMLRNGGGAVVQGTYNGTYFHATSILVKHDSTYVAPKNGQLPPNDDRFQRK